MSTAADAARERRWKTDGGRRLTARVSSQAHDALVALAARYRMDQRTVLDALLVAAGAQANGRIEDVVRHAMAVHGFSPIEARDFVEMGGAAAAALQA